MICQNITPFEQLRSASVHHSYSCTRVPPLPSTIYRLYMAATTRTPHNPCETFRNNHGGSNGCQDTSETSVGIPFHGSCSRCHHFHINHPLTFSLDSTVHTRLCCERCNHPMFGLGRASTQNTLASVESGSTFSPRACVDQPGQQQQPALQVETGPGTSGLGLLTTITERRSPATSRSTSHIRTLRRTPSAPSLAGEEAGGSVSQGESIGIRALLRSTAQESPAEQALRPQVPTLRRLRTFGRRFKRHFYAKPRDWKLPRLGLQITYAPRADIPSNSSAPAPRTEVSSGHEGSDNPEELVNRTGEYTDDRLASLRARRRELTLARQRGKKCECSPECHCTSGSNIVQVGGTEAVENIPVPGYLFGHSQSSTGSSNSQPSQNNAQGLVLSHIGDHFDSPRRSSSADRSSSAAESGPRRTRLSQGSTLWSNGSSVSLRTRRPLVGRASSMPVVARAQYPVGVRTDSQTTSSTSGSGLRETARAAASLDGGTRPGRISHTGLSQNREVVLHQSSTSLAHIPDPQEDELLVNGVSPRSHTPVPDGDEVTPTPHSGIRWDGESYGALPVGADRLSSALQGLTNGGGTTDHRVHSPDFSASDPSD